MTPIEALEAFLERAAIRRRERHLEFIRSRKRRPDFLATIHHRPEDDLDPELVVEVLPDHALDRAAFLFKHRTFGEPISSLRALTDSETNGCLAVSADASAAVLRGEHDLDDQVFFLLEGPSGSVSKARVPDGRST